MFELRLLCAEDQVEALSDALEALDALSVSVEDADAHTDAERALFGEPGLPPPKEGWQRSRVLALFPDETAATQAARLLRAQDFLAGGQVQEIVEVADQDWVRLTQSQFAPVQVTPEFWIVPTWHEPPAQARQVIRLDPGLAFGTGTHPTTRMCLRWIARHRLQGQRVLDYGCGSGILAIGAARFGAGTVDAVDIDEAAVRATLDNAQANGVGLHAVGLPDKASGPYDVVLANILATPLKVLAPLLCAHLATGADLVLAGILERQAQELVAAYAPYLPLSVADTEDGWILMTGSR
ncbi:MAG: 50S ribosomal protein L11 methyltransferase [Ramlibacter sp.]